MMKELSFVFDVKVEGEGTVNTEEHLEHFG
jgi:hypothetical protein